MTMRFGLQLGGWSWPGGGAELAPRLGAIARTAEEVGFSSISVMDHFIQIPTVGREWEDMPESTATLGFLAAATTTARLGALVNGVTYRNLAHLAKIVATLDVLSGGRAFCGLGTAWFGREHELYGWDFPPVARRYELLEDALELLPLMWGKGSPRVHRPDHHRAGGDVLPAPAAGARADPRRRLRRAPDAAPRGPLRRRLQPVRLAGRGGPQGRRAARALPGRRRDPATVTVTTLSEAAILGGSPGAAERYDACVGTVEEQIGRYRQYAEVGVARGDRRPPPRRHPGPGRGLRPGDRRVPDAACVCGGGVCRGRMPGVLRSGRAAQHLGANRRRALCPRLARRGPPPRPYARRAQRAHHGRRDSLGHHVDRPTWCWADRRRLRVRLQPRRLRCPMCIWPRFATSTVRGLVARPLVDERFGRSGAATDRMIRATRGLRPARRVGR